MARSSGPVANTARSIDPFVSGPLGYPGQHIKIALLTCRKAGKEQQEFLKIKLDDFIVSSYQTGGSAGSALIPIDQISMNFSKIEYEYKEQKPDGTLGGTVKANYDVKANKGN